MNVIPKVGQVWVRDNSGLKVVLLDVSQSGYVWDSANPDIKLSGTVFEPMHNSFTLKPANDLEWRAVNESNWDGDSAGNLNIARFGDNVVYGDYRHIAGGFTRKQWQDKRDELFGVKMNIDDIEKDVKPVYTQAMCDAGELPPVGVTCEAMEFGNKWHLVEVFAHHGNTAHFYMPNLDDYGHSEGVNGNFRLLDTRTDKEKLVDDVSKYLEYNFRDDDIDIDFNEEAKSMMERFDITRKES